MPDKKNIQRSSRILLKREVNYERQKVTGLTLDDTTGHVHEYIIDPMSGNGWALETSHPDEDRIKHSHKIERFVVQPSKSNCYPNCKSKYEVDGIGYHGHPLPNLND